MDRKDLILGALAALGEGAELTPAQVQKLFFVLDREAAHLLDGPHFNFQPYDYGPFDKTVYDELARLERHGLASTTTTGRYRRYGLTAAGIQAGREVLAALPVQTQNFVRELAAWIKQLSFQQLVSAIYSKYPDMKVNSIFRG